MTAATPPARDCREAGCSRPARVRGRCKPCYERWRLHSGEFHRAWLPPATGTERAELAAALRARYETGARIQELAQASGRSFGTVRTLLLEAGTQLRPRGGKGRRSPGRDASG